MGGWFHSSVGARWVGGGCRAEFAPQYSGKEVRCEGSDGRYKACGRNLYGNADLIRQRAAGAGHSAGSGSPVVSMMGVLGLRVKAQVPPRRSTTERRSRRESTPPLPTTETCSAASG